MKAEYDVQTEGKLSCMPANGEGRSERHVDVHTEIKAHVRHPVFFSCKEVGVLLPEFCTYKE